MSNRRPGGKLQLRADKNGRKICQARAEDKERKECKSFYVPEHENGRGNDQRLGMALTGLAVDMSERLD